MKRAGIFPEVFSGSELRWIHEDRGNGGSVGSGQFFCTIDENQVSLVEGAHRRNENDRPWQSVAELSASGKGILTIRIESALGVSRLGNWTDLTI